MQELAAHVHRDLLAEVAGGHGDGHVGNIANLGGEVGGHGVHAFGEVFPGARHPFDLRLAAELALGAYLPRHAGDLRRERAELLDHRVDGLAGPEEFALQRAVDGFQRDALSQIALGHRANDAGHFLGGRGQVSDERVETFALGGPRPFDAAHVHPVGDLALLADNLAGALRLLGQALVQLHNVVEGIGNLPVEADPFEREAGREIAMLDSGEDGEQQL